MESLTRRSILLGMTVLGASNLPPARADETAWIRCADLPLPRSEMPATELDGIIYIAGGFGAADRANAYDPELDEWSDLPNLPVETNHPGITSWNGHIVVAGGYASDGSTAHDGIWAWQPKDTAWTQIGMLPHPMGAFGFVTVAEQIVVVGGAIDSLNGHPTDETWLWNPDAEEWTSATPLPRAREHLATAAREGMVYVAGGRVHGQASPELGEALDIFDPATDSWTTGSPLSPPRSGLNGANVHAGLVVAGGETPTEVFADVNLLDPVSGQWPALPDLPTALHGIAVAAVGSHVYTIGGSATAGAIDNVNEVWRMDVPMINDLFS